MSFIARSQPRERDDDGRGISPPHAPADFYLSALVDLLAINSLTIELQGSVTRARSQCTLRRTEALDLALSVIRSRAEDIRKQATALQAKLSAIRADEIDDATQVYGV